MNITPVIIAVLLLNSCLQPRPPKPTKRVGLLNELTLETKGNLDNWSVDETFLWQEKDNGYLISHASGESFPINFEQKTLGLPLEIDPQYKLENSFSLGASGWMTYNSQEIRRLDLNFSELQKYTIPLDLTDRPLIGIAPQMLAFQNGPELDVFLSDDKDFIHISEIQDNQLFEAIGPCEKQCLLWGLLEGKFYIKKDRFSDWEDTGINIKSPNPEKLVRISASLSYSIEKSKWYLTHLLAIDEQLRFYYLKDLRNLTENGDASPNAPEKEGSDTIPNEDNTPETTIPGPEIDKDWERLLGISQKVCIPCHSSDGFNQKGFWLDNASKIIERTKTLDGAGAMPPARSRFYDIFDSADREFMNSWLEKAVP